MRKTDKKVSLIFVIFQFFTVFSFSQNWVRSYSNPTKSAIAHEIIECYDHGYILGSVMCIGLGGLEKIGWIIKTDINGNVIWDKKIGNGTRIWEIEGIDKTPDGGLILTGGADTLDNEWYDPWVAKLDACGEIEWCRIFHSDGLNSGRQIKYLPDNSSIFLLDNWSNWPDHNSVWLMHLDPSGGIIWEQEYFENDPLFIGVMSHKLTITPEWEYLISGTCYYPDSGQVQPWWIQPMLIKADSSGEAVWELPWGYALNFEGEGFQSVVSGSGQTVITCISNYSRDPANVYYPALTFTSADGVPVAWKNLKDSTTFGKASTIDLMGNTSDIFVSSAYELNDTAFLSVFRTDTNGLVKKEKVLAHSEYLPKDAVTTWDNKLLITAPDIQSNKYYIKLWKLNSDLEYDSIYTQPFTYDSLCPHAIVSDTLYPQCDVIMGMQEPAKNTPKVKMHVYPNPCHTVLHVGMPECIQKESKTEHYTVTTIFHQRNKDLLLQCFDLFGKSILTIPVKPGEKEAVIDVSQWKRGIYFLRLQYGDSMVASEKVVVE